MSRPHTLAQAAERIAGGEAPVKAVSEFLDTFYTATERQARLAMLSEEPRLSARAQTDALLGAVCEYLCKQHRLDGVPSWASKAERFLSEPWFTTSDQSDGMREYLTFSSPTEFASRNIFCERSPLRRASQRP